MSEPIKRELCDRRKVGTFDPLHTHECKGVHQDVAADGKQSAADRGAEGRTTHMHMCSTCRRWFA